MKATWLYRIAAILLLLFAAGHTIGFLKFVPPTPEGQAVLDAMNNVHLQPGAAYTYGGFYRGFGLFATVYFLFAAFVAWHLGELARKLPTAAGGLFRPPRPLHRLGRVRYAIEPFAKRLGIPQKPRPCPNLSTILVGLPVEKSSPIN